MVRVMKMRTLTPVAAKLMKVKDKELYDGSDAWDEHGS